MYGLSDHLNGIPPTRLIADRQGSSRYSTSAAMRKNRTSVLVGASRDQAQPKRFFAPWWRRRFTVKPDSARNRASFGPIRAKVPLLLLIASAASVSIGPTGSQKLPSTSIGEL